GERPVVLEEPVHAEATRVYDPLGDPLVVEVEELLPEVEVLQRRRAALADPQRVLVVADRDALLRRQRGTAVRRQLGELGARTRRRRLPVRRRAPTVGLA